MPEAATSTLSLWAPFTTLGFIVVNGGWLVLALAVLKGLYWWYMMHLQLKWYGRIKQVLLAIDIPKDNEQSPKAVEHIFSQLHGIFKSGNLIEKYWYGYHQMHFSIELVSIDGYIQFLIRTPQRYRDLVEAAVYAQYPDAEISEAEDYTAEIPHIYPDDEYNVWGTELKLIKSSEYPIRMYQEFEHSLSQEFKDPMAGLLEMLSRLKVGEQYWMQINIAPANSDWREHGKALIMKLIGKKVTKKEGLGWLASNVGQGVTESFTASLIPTSDLNAKAAREENRWPTQMQHLSPDERSIVEAIGIKLGKLGFVAKIRLVYVAKKDVFSPSTRVQAVMGALKQFTAQDLNGFSENKKTRTRVVYPPIQSILDWRLNRRRKKILFNYKVRSFGRGRSHFILNIEELASFWHFPVITVKAPLVQKTESRKGEPPMALPLHRPTGNKAAKPVESPVADKAPVPPSDTSTKQVPTNLPVIE